MLIFENLNELSKELSTRPTVVTLGVFDGVHIGHQKILQETVNTARSYPNGQAVVFTFKEHPDKILNLEEAPPAFLTTLEERLDFFSSFGIDIVVLSKFDSHLANIEAEHFVTKILLSSFTLKAIVAGMNHRFGKNAEGDIFLLERLGRQFGFKVIKVENVEVEGLTVSSTLIRQLISDGKVELAEKMLNRKYSFCGVVIKGDQRGEKLGYPTANLAVENVLIPKDGVYAIKAQLLQKQEERLYPGMLYIGKRPTFQKKESVIEVHLFDFSGNLYGERIRVFLIKKIREDRKFSDAEALVAQMREDEKAARILTENYNF